VRTQAAPSVIIPPSDECAEAYIVVDKLGVELAAALKDLAQTRAEAEWAVRRLEGLEGLPAGKRQRPT
jgi:hypothetical protein